MVQPRETLSAPTTVSLMITRRCNLRCLYCGSAPEQFLRGDMTTQELLSTIDELARHQVFRIMLTGGEPLGHHDFFPIVAAILGQRMRLQINTNATLVTETVVARFRQLPRRPLFSVTVDGMTRETYAHVRGVDAFGRMQSGITALVAGGFRVRPFVVLHRLNYRELPQIVAFARSIGAKSVAVSMPLRCGRAPYHAEEMVLRGNELRKALEISLRLKNDYPGLLTGPWSRMVDFYRCLAEGRLTDLPQAGQATFSNCPGGITQLTIASDGTIVPCDLAYTCRAGNLRDQSFDEIWRTSGVLKKIRYCQGLPLAQIRGCEDCPWHHVCRGPCPGAGYAATGVWPATGPACTRREIGRLLGYEAAVSPSGKVS
jgi:SynChlorMet cassette radical SAM/SPASM protein ScmE